MSESDATSSDIGFERLQLSEWRQFDRIDVEFHPRLTVLTGANATGKSTILGLLAVHFDWSRVYSAQPISSRSKTTRWSFFGWGRRPSELENVVGTLRYTNGIMTQIQLTGTLDEERRSNYNLRFADSQPVAGSFLTSHRSIPGNYVDVPSIPTSFATSQDLLNSYTQEIRTRWQGGWSGRSPQHAFKESLIAAAVFGQPANEFVETNPEAAEIWAGYQRVLADLLPKTLGFQGLRVRVPDVVVRTRTGDFLLDDASGGLVAIMEIAWQVFLRSRTLPSFTVLMDEPENHLHPSLQRDLLPGFIRAFPKVRFIVATHSPFVVTATPDSRVYALEYNTERRVISRELDYANKAANADETLQRVLGLSSTMPQWAEARFDAIVRKYLGRGLSRDQLGELRQELDNVGLGGEFPDAIVQLDEAARQDQADR